MWCPADVATLYIVVVVLTVYCRVLRVQRGNASTRQTAVRPLPLPLQNL